MWHVLLAKFVQVNLKKRESKSGFFKSIGDVLGGSFNKFYEVDEVIPVHTYLSACLSAFLFPCCVVV